MSLIALATALLSLALHVITMGAIVAKSTPPPDDPGEALTRKNTELNRSMSNPLDRPKSRASSARADKKKLKRSVSFDPCVRERLFFLSAPSGRTPPLDDFSADTPDDYSPVTEDDVDDFLENEPPSAVTPILARRSPLTSLPPLAPLHSSLPLPGAVGVRRNSVDSAFASGRKSPSLGGGGLKVYSPVASSPKGRLKSPLRYGARKSVG